MINYLFSALAILFLIVFLSSFFSSKIGRWIKCGFLITALGLAIIASTLVIIPPQTSGVVFPRQQTETAIKVWPSGWHLINPLTENMVLFDLDSHRFQTSDFLALTKESNLVKLNFSVDWIVESKDIASYFGNQTQFSHKNLANLTILKTLQTTIAEFDRSLITKENLLPVLEDNLCQALQKQKITFKRLTIQEIEFLGQKNNLTQLMPISEDFISFDETDYRIPILGFSSKEQMQKEKNNALPVLLASLFEYSGEGLYLGNK